MAQSFAQPSFETSDPNEEYICPYDPVHRISAKRLIYHLQKCRRNHNASDYVRCPFNARHEIPRQELEFHVSTCPDKDIIRQDIDPTPTYISRSSNRPATPPPTQGTMAEDTEDWDDEADCEHFLPSTAARIEDAERVDGYAILQTLYQAQEVLHGNANSSTPVNVADMTPAQKKNYKRTQKRQEKRIAEGYVEDEGPNIDEVIQQHDLISGIHEGGFVDFISHLNIYCQQNQINPPQYREGPGVSSGFGYQVTIKTNVFQTKKHCKTKKEAKQNAAMVACLGLNIKFGADPLPNKKSASMSVKARDRARQTHEQQLLGQSREAGYQQARPVLQTPSSFTGATRKVNLPNGHNGHSQGLEQAMVDLSVSQQQQYNGSDSWTTVPTKSSGVRNQVYDYSLKKAGRGRGKVL